MTESHFVTTTRSAYEAAAETYAQWVGTELTPATENALEVSLLGAFADLVAATPGCHVADIGCGTGRAAAFLASRGLDVTGVDLSPAMLTIAARTHPAITFAEGQLDDLPLAGRSVHGIVCWYSIIHTPPEHLGDVCGELARVLIPPGHVLLAFQAGNGEPVQRAAYGTDVPLTSYRHHVETVERHLSEVGLRIHARTIREPELAHESTPQALIFARSAATK